MKIITHFVFFILICFIIHIPSASAYDVVFNTKTLVYHTFSCEWARKCTKSCITIDHILAQRRGGVPCKVCGRNDISGNYKNPYESNGKNKELAEIERLQNEINEGKRKSLEKDSELIKWLMN